MDSSKSLPKTATGIVGFDEITQGGLPSGRPTLLCGEAGSGKTLFSTTFLVTGTTRYDEPGVFMSFEEKEADLIANVASLGFDLPELIRNKRLLIDHVHIERSEIAETGEYDLEGLFVRLDYAINQIGAKRVVLDTLEALFSGFLNDNILRAELRRLFSWLKEKGVTAVITGERGDGALTRFGIEEYVSDCVILLDNRVTSEIATRRLRIVKYRGSAHGTNEYPFLIDDQGISVFPVTSARLDHKTSEDVISTGIEQLNIMFSRGGYFRGSSILISGLAGTGKTTFAAKFAKAVCDAGEKALYFAFEESPDQIVRNMHSIGLDLDVHRRAGKLQFEAARPSLYGLELHLARMHLNISRFNPSAVIIDPISAFRGPPNEVHAILLRLVDLLKSRGVTGLFTSLSSAEYMMDRADHNISSLMDIWLSLSNTSGDGERNRLLYVLKARGMGHSNQLREYEITSQGIRVIPAYIGASGVLTGSARIAREALERDQDLGVHEEAERRERELKRKRLAVEREIADMLAELEDAEQEAAALLQRRTHQLQMLEADRSVMAQRRR